VRTYVPQRQVLHSRTATRKAVRQGQTGCMLDGEDGWQSRATPTSATLSYCR